MNTKILKRALEMAAKIIFGLTRFGGLGQSCVNCPVKQPCFTKQENGETCSALICNHFIKQATAEIKAKEIKK